MAKIDEEMFEGAVSSANLKDTRKVKKPDALETKRESTVYDIPVAWLTAIKNNNSGLRSFSGFARAAVYEKLVRDGLIEDK